MKRFLTFLVALMVGMTSCSMSDDEMTDNDNTVNVGDPLPTFTVTMYDGTLLSTADLLGKPSLLVLFSTTCGDCRRELPDLNLRYLQHGGDTTFVAISREQPEAEVAAYWSQHGLSLPYSAQSDRTIYHLFARSGIPRIYIADAEGIIRSISVPE